MGKGGKDRNARRRDRYARQRAENEAAARAREVAAAQMNELAEAHRVQLELSMRWGGEQAALSKLQRIAEQLRELEARRTELGDERDALVASLRAAGHSWSSLAMRTGTSRQGLAKRQSSPAP